MDYLNINRQLLEQLAEITASMERITKGEAVHPLDKDLLLSQIRDLYSTALKIGTMAEETKIAGTSMEGEQDKPRILTPEELQELHKAKESTEKDSETENIDYESYMDVHEPFDEPEPEPTPEPEPEISQNEKTDTTLEPEIVDEAKLYGPQPDVFKEIQPQESNEEEVAEPEPVAEVEPEPAPKVDPNRVTNRKNAIEDLVAQSQTPKTEEPEPPKPEPEPQPEQPQHKGPQPQLTLLDYLSGASHVVENVVEQSPVTPKNTVEKINEQHQPHVQPEEKPTPTTSPIEQQPAQAAPATPKYTDLRSLIGIND